MQGAVTVTRMKITHFYVNPQLSTLQDAAINYRQLHQPGHQNIPRQVSPSPRAIWVMHEVSEGLNEKNPGI